MDNTICDVPDFSFITYENKSVRLSYYAQLSNVNTSLIIVIENQVHFDELFIYENATTILTQQSSVNKDAQNFTVYTQLETVDGTLYQTNVYNVNLLIDKPPAVVNPMKNYTFYKNQQNRTIGVPSDLFIDDSKISVYVDKCFTITNQLVGVTIPKYEDNVLVSFNLYFDSSFIGNCTISLYAVDEANQTSTTHFTVFVRPCAQIDCFACNSEYQSSCFRCNDGYSLKTSTGQCIETNNTIQSYGFGMLAYLALIFMIIIKIEIFVSIDYILYNQLILFLCLMNSQATGNLNEILNSIQYTKFDLKFMDYVFYSRNSVNNYFWTSQQRDLSIFNFDSGSTFANYINLAFIILIMIIISVLASMLKDYKRILFIPVICELCLKIFGNIKVYFIIFLMSLHYVCLNLISELLYIISSASNHSNFLEEGSNKVSLCIFLATLIIMTAICVYFYIHRSRLESILEEYFSFTRFGLAIILKRIALCLVYFIESQLLRSLLSIAIQCISILLIFKTLKSHNKLSKYLAIASECCLCATIALGITNDNKEIQSIFAICFILIANTLHLIYFVISIMSKILKCTTFIKTT